MGNGPQNVFLQDLVSDSQHDNAGADLHLWQEITLWSALAYGLLAWLRFFVMIPILDNNSNKSDYDGNNNSIVRVDNRSAAVGASREFIDRFHVLARLSLIHI